MAHEKVRYEIIKLAVQNDEAAIAEIILNYKNYIRYLSLREVVFFDAKTVQCVDEEMVLRMETKLIESIGKFKMRKAEE